MSRITVLNLTRPPVQRLAFGMACVLLLASSNVIADDSEDISEHLLRAETALENNQYQEAASEYRKAA